MWNHDYVAQSTLPCEQLWTVLADVARWPESDHNIDHIHIDQPPEPGTPFKLKVRGGPLLRFVIGDFDPPHRYSDICRLPMAEMHTRHQLLPTAGGTEIRVSIAIKGPLAGLWGWLVGRKHAAGLPAQTERLIASAQARAAM